MEGVILPFARRRAQALGYGLRARHAHAVRSKNDLDVKEIVNPWAGGSAAVKSMLGRCLNECAKARDYLCLACRHAEPNWLSDFAERGLSIRETGEASAGMSPVAGQVCRRSGPDA
jgi:hypothetical protein